MVDIDAWAGDTFPLSTWIDDVDPGVDTARLIADKSTSITIVRAGTEQDAQTVRIEDIHDRPRSYMTEAGETGQAEVLVIGYKGHPSISDTDIQRGDRFAVAGVGYEVVAVVPGLTDQLQAYAKVRS
jgi:hypothetical protein